MPKSANQKRRVIEVARILYEQSDEEHPIRTSELIAKLSAAGIEAERKAVYDDIEALREAGFDIILCAKKNGGYYIGNRAFELPELKLLVDAVQSSKVISAKKSQTLIKKLSSFAGVNESKVLRSQVCILNRVKTPNESFYYSVYTLHQAISDDCKVSFRYFSLTPSKGKRYHNNGERYIITPCGLLWDDENYYLVGYDDASGITKHFRVDKMEHLEKLEEKRVKIEFDAAEYAKRHFNMFGGDERNVVLSCDNDLAGVIFDRFGDKIMVIPKRNGTFSVAVSVVVSDNFYSWVFAFGTRIKIESPSDVREGYKKAIEKALSQFI